MVKHLVDIGDQITLHGETGQRCELDDTQIVGILRLRGLNVFARMTEAVLIHLCVGRLLCPSLHRGGAQKRRRAVDGHGIGTAHAMTARITEGKRRIDGALDFEQAVKHGVLRTRRHHVILHPLLASRTPARGSGIAGGRALPSERRAASFTAAFGTRREPVHPQRHRFHAVLHAAHIPAFR